MLAVSLQVIHAASQAASWMGSANYVLTGTSVPESKRPAGREGTRHSPPLTGQSSWSSAQVGELVRSNRALRESTSSYG